MRVHLLVSMLVAVGAATAIPHATVEKRAQPSSALSWNFGTQMTRGVNIGGWLVLEPWITPSFFKDLDPSVVDEWTLGKNVKNALSLLTTHWDNWVSKADFQRIHDAGFNTVRIPIGYWAFEKIPGDFYTQGALPYLDKAIRWANETDLKVWIDLHGAPGSQNGFDNSGQLILKDKNDASSGNVPGWGSGNTVQQTLEIFKKISTHYAQPAYQDVVVALEVLNEPVVGAVPSLQTVTNYYNATYQIVRDVSDTPVMLHDAFQYQVSGWNALLPPPNLQEPGPGNNVVIDHHEYQVFTNDLVAMSYAEHQQLVCSNVKNYGWNTDHWIVVGEWTGALTDCASSLNGRGVGARYDGTYPHSTRVGSCDFANDITKWSAQQRQQTTDYIEQQISVFEQFTKGWVFWNFKTESAPEWDLFKLLDAKIFPQPLTATDHDYVCSY